MNTFMGLPAHILIVHFVVVFVPLSGLMTVLSAVWPAARTRLGVITPIVAIVAAGTAKLAEDAGKWLQYRVFATDLIRRHTALGEDLLPWAAALAIVAVLAWLLPYLVGRGRGQGRLDAIWVRIIVAVLAVGLAGVSSLQVYRIGDSGARAAWSGNVCAVPYENGTCPNNQFLH